jgi:DNA-binding response OmpR family regulator
MKGEPLRILLVEDNDDHAEAVKRSFRRHQMRNELTHVRDGEAALDFLLGRGVYGEAASRNRPHLVILDLRLPKVDGLEVLKVIKTTKELVRLPVVVLTSSKAEVDVVRAYEYHANSYVVKPLDFDKFVGLMKVLGFYWLAWNANPYPEEQQ